MQQAGYAFHIQGRRHQLRQEPCQDYSLIYDIPSRREPGVPPTYRIAVVADGVSTSKHAKIASQMACEEVCRAIENALPFDSFSNKLLEDYMQCIIIAAMHQAQNTIEKYADERNEPYENFDTTLALAVYVGKKVYIGFVGDSGVGILKDDGDILFTTPQNDDVGHVYPLRCRWKYATGREENVAGVFCMTDGIFKDFLGSRKTDYARDMANKRAKTLIPFALQDDTLENPEKDLPDFRSQVAQSFMEDTSLTDDMSIACLLSCDWYICTDKPLVGEIMRPTVSPNVSQVKQREQVLPVSMGTADPLISKTIHAIAPPHVQQITPTTAQSEPEKGSIPYEKEIDPFLQTATVTQISEKDLLSGKVLDPQTNTSSTQPDAPAQDEPGPESEKKNNN